jgi:DNA invertase Pin-like site-specific DNA recombinase
MAKIGYARVSTKDQVLDLQIDSLAKAGCERIFSDVVSGAKADRPGLNKCLAHLKKGDTLIVWKFDRLARSIRHLLELFRMCMEKGIGFVSLSEKMDAATPSGRLHFHLIAAMAEFERDLIQERVQAGLKAARAQGRRGGRPKKLDAQRTGLLLSLYRSRGADYDWRAMCKLLDCSKSTLYKTLSEHGFYKGKEEEQNVQNAVIPGCTKE